MPNTWHNVSNKQGKLETFTNKNYLNLQFSCSKVKQATQEPSFEYRQRFFASSKVEEDEPNKAIINGKSFKMKEKIVIVADIFRIRIHMHTY